MKYAKSVVYALTVEFYVLIAAVTALIVQNCFVQAAILAPTAHTSV